MTFTSVPYMLFLPAVTLLYWLVPHKGRLPILLAASYFFYACLTPFFAIWLVFITVISYLAGVLLNKCTEGRAKKRLCMIATLLILGVLFIFKYLNFTIDQLNTLLSLGGAALTLPHYALIMPLGLSFFSFQALGYVYDVSRGTVPAEQSLLKYALFIAFFPHLGQGPIDRAQQLLPQLEAVHRFDSEAARHALVLILFGTFKKIVIADRLAMLVDEVFGNLDRYSGLALWLASVFYTFQIYCEFSGYTDIALGSAELLGFRLQENFKCPYLAESIADFWRRWHISLSRWFRDYLYIPLGGNRVSSGRWALNVLIVFLVSGLWHGAAWTFILWGLLHGLFQVIGKYKRKWLMPLLVKQENGFVKLLRICITFFLVNFLWILFRANTTQNMLLILRGLFVWMPGLTLESFGIAKQDLLLSFALIGLVIHSDILNERQSCYVLLNRLPLPVRWLLYSIALFGVILFGVYGSLSASSFIYFNF